MSRRPLESVRRSKSQITKWFNKSFAEWTADFIDAYSARNEVTSGVLMAVPSTNPGAADVIQLNYTAGAVLLGGKMLEVASGTDAEVAPNTIQPLALPPIALDGTHTDTEVFLSALNDFYDAVLVGILSNGAGAPGDDMRMLVVHGALNTAGVPTPQQVEAAINANIAAAAAGWNYAGNGGWVILGSFRAVADAAGLDTISDVVENRNNYLSR